MTTQLHHHGNTIASQWQQATHTVRVMFKCGVHHTLKLELLVTRHTMTPVCDNAGLCCLNLCLHSELYHRSIFSVLRVSISTILPSPLSCSTSVLPPVQRTCLAALDTNGEMVTITEEVSPYTAQCCLQTEATPMYCVQTESDTQCVGGLGPTVNK